LALLLLESKNRCGDDFRGELFDLILDQRAADMVDIRGGASGLLVRDYKGKEADRLVPAATPAWSRWSPNCTATSGGRQGIGAVEGATRGASAPRRIAGGDYPGCDLYE
jgi:hypothetical protein